MLRRTPHRLITALTLCTALSAGTVYWDTQPGTAEAQPGTGIWTVSGINWWSPQLEQTNPWQAGDTAVFSGTGYSVDVQSALDITGLEFTGSGVRLDMLSGGSKLVSSGSLSGSGQLAFNGQIMFINPGDGNLRYPKDLLLQRGLWFDGGGQVEIGPDIRFTQEFPSNFNGSPVLGVTDHTTVTFKGSWTADGGGAFSWMALTNGGKLIISEEAHVDLILAGGNYFTREMWVYGDGTGVIEFEEGFVADHTAQATVEDGWGSIRLGNVTMITHHTQSIPFGWRPEAVKDAFGNPDEDGLQPNGHVIFLDEGGGKWITRTNPQTYSSVLAFTADGTIQTETDLTHTGYAVYSNSHSYWANNAFQTRGVGVTITKSGPATLTIANQAAFSQDSVLRVEEGRFVFQCDPAAGFLQIHSKDPDAAGPVAGPSLHADVLLSGTLTFEAPEAGILSANIQEGTLELKGQLTLAGDYSQNDQEVIGQNPRPNRPLEPEAGTLRVWLNSEQSGQLVVEGTASLGGRLQLFREEGFTPPAGTTFDIIMSDSYQGDFHAIDDYSDLGLTLEYLSDRVRVTSTRLASTRGVVINEDWTNGTTSHPDWHIIDNSNVGIMATNDRPDAPTALVRKIGDGTFLWGIAFLDLPAFRAGPEDVVVIDMETFADVAFRNHNLAKVEIALLHVDPHAPFGHDNATEVSRNYGSHQGDQWQIVPSVDNQEVRLANAHHTGASNGQLLRDVERSLTLFRPGEGETQVEMQGTAQTGERTINATLQVWNHIQLSMPMQWQDNSNPVLAEGVSQADAQLGLAKAHVGITHRSDISLDYVTDGLDYILAAANLSKASALHRDGDTNNDGQVNNDDLDDILAHLGHDHDLGGDYAPRYAIATPSTATVQVNYDANSGQLTLQSDQTIQALWLPVTVAPELPEELSSLTQSYADQHWSLIDPSANGQLTNNRNLATLSSGLTASSFAEGYFLDENGAVGILTFQVLGEGPNNPFASLPVVDGWKYSFLGYIGADEFYPWFYHLNWGWVWGTGNPDSYFLYDLQLGWIYTSSQLYPFLYHYRSEQWVYYASGTSPQRYYFDSAGNWVLETDLP